MAVELIPRQYGTSAASIINHSAAIYQLRLDIGEFAVLPNQLCRVSESQTLATGTSCDWWELRRSLESASLILHERGTAPCVTQIHTRTTVAYERKTSSTRRFCEFRQMRSCPTDTICIARRRTGRDVTAAMSRPSAPTMPTEWHDTG
jgi:hypothetical protein